MKRYTELAASYGRRYFDLLACDHFVHFRALAQQLSRQGRLVTEAEWLR